MSDRLYTLADYLPCASTDISEGYGNLRSKLDFEKSEQRKLIVRLIDYMILEPTLAFSEVI